MKKFFLLIMVVLSICACGPKTENSDESSNTSNYFIFNDGDTCVYEFAYGRYIPVDKNDSVVRYVSSEYVRYHNDDSVSLIFTKDYIRKLCLNSRCITEIKEDTIFGFGKVREMYFPEAYIGFAYDEWEEMIVYSFINFGDDIWYTDILADGITVTSDAESAIWDLLPYVTDSINASIEIYVYDEISEPKLDSVKNTYINFWDVIRNFYQYPISTGIKTDNFIVYMNGAGLKLIKSTESDHLCFAYFSEYTINDSLALCEIEDCFMDKLNELPMRDGNFIEPYEQQ